MLCQVYKDLFILGKNLNMILIDLLWTEIDAPDFNKSVFILMTFVIVYVWHVYQLKYLMNKRPTRPTGNFLRNFNMFKI